MSFDREAALQNLREVTRGLEKQAIASPETSRPGAPGAVMGQEMAPYPIKQQPATAATTQSLMGKKLVMYPARKSTSAMKRNSGSVITSAERQKPKRTSGGLIGNTEPLLQENKTALASASVAKAAVKKRLAELFKASKSGKPVATNTTVGYTKEKKKEAALEKEAWVGALARGWQAARGVGARLFGAGRGGAVARGAQMELPLAGAASRAAPAAEGALGYANLPGYSRVVSAGKGSSVPGAFHKAREVAQKTPGYLFGRGSGFKNVYRTKDTGKVFSSYRPRTFRPKNWEVVKAYHQTGGVVNRAAKGMVGGAVKGGLGAYGLSWALNRQAAWDDPKRLNMALGGAVLFPSMFQGGPAALGTMAAMASSDKLRGYAGRFTPSVGALWNTRKGGKFDPDRTKTMTNMQMLMTPSAKSKKERRLARITKGRELNRSAAEATKKRKMQQGQSEASAAEGARVQSRQDQAVKAEK
jgi:hypothetical protein